MEGWREDRKPSSVKQEENRRKPQNTMDSLKGKSTRKRVTGNCCPDLCPFHQVKTKP